MLNPSTKCFLQGSQVLVMDSRIVVKDAYEQIVHQFPLADFGAVSDQGEFYQKISLNSTAPSYIFDETLTGYTGNTFNTDIDLLYISTDAPVMVNMANNIALNSTTPGSRNPRGGTFDIDSLFLLRTNWVSGTTPIENEDQRILPFKIYIANGISSANIIVYMTKFSS